MNTLNIKDNLIIVAYIIDKFTNSIGFLIPKIFSNFFYKKGQKA
jgi:hypothetical protein